MNFTFPLTTIRAIAKAAGLSRPMTKTYGTGSNNLTMADFANVPTGIQLA